MCVCVSWFPDSEGWVINAIPIATYPPRHPISTTVRISPRDTTKPPRVSVPYGPPPGSRGTRENLSIPGRRAKGAPEGPSLPGPYPPASRGDSTPLSGSRHELLNARTPASPRTPFREPKAGPC